MFADRDWVDLWDACRRTDELGRGDSALLRRCEAAAQNGQIGANDGVITIAWYGLTYAPLHADPMLTALNFYAQRLGLNSPEPLTCLDLGAGPGTTAGGLAGALESAGPVNRRVQYIAVDHNPHQLGVASEMLQATQPTSRVTRPM